MFQTDFAGILPETIGSIVAGIIGAPTLFLSNSWAMLGAGLGGAAGQT